jgi:hypothetical protein
MSLFSSTRTCVGWLTASLSGQGVKCSWRSRLLQRIGIKKGTEHELSLLPLLTARWVLKVPVQHALLPCHTMEATEMLDC